MNSAISAGLYIGLLYFAGRGPLSNFVIYCFVTLVNYLGSKYFVFQSDKSHISSAAKFSVLIVGSIAANAGLVWVGAELLGLPYYLAGVFFLLVWAMVSFLSQKYWVFGKQQ